MSVSADVGKELAEDEARRHYERALDRERRGGYNAGYRCFNCKLFVNGAEATCGSCGYRHGGVNHRAQATR